MEFKFLEKHFAKMGARIKVKAVKSGTASSFALNVRQDKKGEFFTLDIRKGVHDELEFVVLDIQRDLRHLLLMVRGRDPVISTGPVTNTGKQKFLCGHDERHWFIAAIPEDRRAKNVQDALDALKPQEVLEAQHAQGVKPKDWHKRRNPGYMRQGEWFFVPCPDLKPGPQFSVLHDEPIQRTGGTPHYVEELIRRGSTTVYVSRQRPEGLTEDEYRDFIAEFPWAEGWNWHVMQRVTEVYAKGKVRHPDHKTITLPFWHRVLLSTEADEARGATVAFLD